KLDLRHLPDGHVCSARDLERALDSIGHKLKPLEIVLINTAAGAAFGEPDYLDRGCGMGPEATLILREQGVRVPALMDGAGTRHFPQHASGSKRRRTLPS